MSRIFSECIGRRTYTNARTFHKLSPLRRERQRATAERKEEREEKRESLLSTRELLAFFFSLPLSFV